MGLVGATIGILLMIWAVVVLCRRREASSTARGCLRRLFASVMILVGLLAAVSGGYLHWYVNRAQPEPLERTLFEGVHYQRVVRSQPRPMVIHVVRIDLRAPGLGFLVTPPEKGAERDLVARRTSRFLDEFGVQVAINAAFFYPWEPGFPWDYYPEPGDPVDVHGVAASRGEIYGEASDAYAILSISADNRVSLLGARDVSEPLYNAVSGYPLLVREGEPMTSLGNEEQPRTAVGMDAERQHLILVLVDGRQPNFSEGATLDELARLMVEFGSYNAVNLDGGGSTTLVVEGEDGSPELLNWPVHSRIPGWERPVASHLGVFASRPP